MRSRNIIYKLLLLTIMFLVVFSLNINNQNVSNAATTISVNNDREPRIVCKKTDKNYLYITLHDSSGIILDSAEATLDGKKCKYVLIEVNDGIYTLKGKRIKDIIRKGGSYSGKKYDYGIKIRNSDLSSKEFKDLYIYSYDYGHACFIKETLKVKKYDGANKKGEYYCVNRAPRATVHSINNKVKVDAVDYTGIKSIKILSKKSNEVVYSFVAGKANDSTKNQKGTTKDGYFYPYKVIEDIDMNLIEKAQKDKPGRYRFRVFVEDLSGIKSEKTMTCTVSQTNTSTNTNKNTNTNTNTNKNTNTNSPTKTNNTSKTNTTKPIETGNGKTYYVSTKGSDSNSGKSADKALKKVKTGIKKLSAGDTLIILSGTYNEKLEIKKSGSKGNPITIKAQGDVTISGKNKSGALLKLDGAKYINIDGLKFADLKADESQGIYLVHGASHITINNCKFKNIKCKNTRDEDKGSQAIYAVGKKGKAIDDLNILNCTLKNIGSGYSENISIEGNCTNVTIKGVKISSDSGFKGNIGICLCIGSGGTRPNNVTVSDCNVSHCRSPYGQTAYGIYVDGGANVKFLNNIVSNCEGGIEVGAEKGNSSHSGRETENVTVRGNKISNCDFGVQIGGYDKNGRTYNVIFDNNTVTSCGGKNSEVLTLSRCKKVTISNSRFISYNKAMIIYNEMSSNDTKEIKFKGNTYSNGGSKNSKYFAWHDHEYNFSKWKSKTGDSGSVFK